MKTRAQGVKQTFDIRSPVISHTGGSGGVDPPAAGGAKFLKWLPRSASESAFPSMIDTFFDRAVPLKGASVAPGTYVQTRGTSIACTKVVITWVSYRDEHGPALEGRPPRNLTWCLWLPSPRRLSARLPTVRLPHFHPPLRFPSSGALSTRRLERILAMQILHILLRHPQQLLVHAPIATYSQHPLTIRVSAAPELQLHIDESMKTAERSRAT